ncbi:SemiSWEET family transporter [Lactococcus muris]|uniref:SemiSWEET family transporter n=1 Tax=Lactococcus muris TaxID=2941330 RepID=UPI002300EF8A
MTKAKFNTLIGTIGATIGVFVFLAYIPQIIANLEGHQGQPYQPLVAAISCLIWVLYGWTKEPQRDYLLILPNAAGVVLGLATFITSI